MRLTLRLPFVFALFCLCVSCLAGNIPSSATNKWNVVASPFRPVNITAQGATIWVCGADEMILSSKDGGATWETKHQNPDGEVLLNISFVTEKVGHAAGTGGLLLSTDDGGQIWKRHVAPGAVRTFSFADAMNGIAVIGNERTDSRVSSSDQAVPIADTVKITRDGGEHWEEIAFLDSEDLQPFVQTLALAALDSSHFLMLRRQPEAEDIFVATKDGGNSWKIVRPRNDATNRELPHMVFVHQGEYWAFGYELIHREKAGGYGVPLTLHSKEGEIWVHGVAGPKEFDACNSQGCYMWDGAVETLYGEHEQFLALPQDGSLNKKKWAIAEGAGCTLDDNTLKCGRAILTEKPADKPEVAGGIIYLNVNNQYLVDGCVDCYVETIVPEHPGPPSMQPLHASISVRRDGTVSNVSVDYPPSKRMSNDISGQLSKWLFEPTHKGSDTVETKKDVSLLLMCSGFPGRPETNRCSLHRSDEFARFRPPVKTALPR